MVLGYCGMVYGHVCVLFACVTIWIYINCTKAIKPIHVGSHFSLYWLDFTSKKYVWVIIPVFFIGIRTGAVPQFILFILRRGNIEKDLEKIVNNFPEDRQQIENRPLANQDVWGSTGEENTKLDLALLQNVEDIKNDLESHIQITIQNILPAILQNMVKPLMEPIHARLNAWEVKINRRLGESANARSYTQFVTGPRNPKWNNCAYGETV